LVKPEEIEKLARHGNFASIAIDIVDVSNAYGSAYKQEGHFDGAVADHTLRTLVGDAGGELGSWALGTAAGAAGSEVAGPPGGVALALAGSYFGGQWGQEDALNLYDRAHDPVLNWVQTHT
jgi:hypothetical protein